MLCKNDSFECKGKTFEKLKNYEIYRSNSFYVSNDKIFITSVSKISAYQFGIQKKK